MTQLIHYDNMRTALMQAHQVDEVKDIRDKAEALRQYARQAGESLENQNMIAEIKLRAERRAGELLRDMERGEPNPHGINQHTVVPGHDDREPEAFFVSEYRSAIEEAAIPERTARRWQEIADLPEERFEQHIAVTKDSGKELTSAGVMREAQAFRREQMATQKQEAPAIPDAKYRVIYADPPWQYNNSGVITETDAYGRAARHYPTMSIAELCAMGPAIIDRTEDNAVLFLWTTSPLLEDSFKVIDAWGFQYKTSFVWDKVRHNFGHYNSVRHEFLLICTRGSCTPDNNKLYDSVVTVERTDNHSEKPDEFRHIIDDLYTWGKRIELFARRPADGWDAWGNDL